MTSVYFYLVFLLRLMFCLSLVFLVRIPIYMVSFFHSVHQVFRARQKTVKGVPPEIANDPKLLAAIEEKLPGNYDFEIPKTVHRCQQVRAVLTRKLCLPPFKPLSCCSSGKSAKKIGLSSTSLLLTRDHMHACILHMSLGQWYACYHTRMHMITG